MPASVLPVREPDSTAAPSDYADQMPLLYELASLPEGDPVARSCVNG